MEVEGIEEEETSSKPQKCITETPSSLSCA